MFLEDFEIWESDTLFADSPDAGEPECVCSRCLGQIGEEETPLRVFVDEGRVGEYRYCPACSGLQVGPKDFEEDEILL